MNPELAAQPWLKLTGGGTRFDLKETNPRISPVKYPTATHPTVWPQWSWKLSKEKKIIDRKTRLNSGRCPIHGMWMSQIDSWYYPENEKPYTIVGCPRNDCVIYAKAYDFDGPWELPKEFLGLLDHNLPDPVYLIPDAQPVKRRKKFRVDRKVIWKKTNGKCYYCGSKISRSKVTIDHLHPVAKGGSNDVENLVPTCRSCNSSKGTKSVEEFRYFRMMQAYENENGVSFTEEQVIFLLGQGFDLKLSIYKFWFEEPDN